MPKQTFFNLPEHKKKKLLESAEIEFARVPLFEASIANIIKMAGVSRGSFYQYFEDKDDIYFYLVDEKVKTAIMYFVSLLEKHNGDLMEALTEMYYFFLYSFSDEEEKHLLRNALLFTTYKVESSFTSMLEKYLENEQFKQVEGLINKEHLNISEDKDLLHIFKLVSGLAFNNLIEKTVKGLSDEEAMDSFKRSMHLIKHGVYK